MGEALRRRLLGSIEAAVRDSVRAKEELIEKGSETILEMAEALGRAFRQGNKLLLFGNGGSAADAQHLAAEFVNRFVMERAPLPAIALTVDSSVLTSIGNDFLFEDVFLKQVQALGRPGDVALGISTSGRSPNVVKALKWAKENGLTTMGLGGSGVAEMDAHCQMVLHISSQVTARVQECHITAGHVLCGLVEELLFGDDSDME